MHSAWIYRLAIAIILVSLCTVCVQAQDNVQAEDAPCLSTEHQEVAFLTGEWSVVSRQRVGPSSNDWVATPGEARWRQILDGCVMEESWSGTVGETRTEWVQLISFNSRHESWERSFVDSAHGNLIKSEGTMDDGSLIFNDTQTRRGQLLIDRTTFEPIDADSFHVQVESSFDGGKSWILFWELYYSRR